MPKCTRNFASRITELWGEPKAVIEECLNELFRVDGISLDHDDQVEYAWKIGLLVGQVDGRGTYTEFITRFEKEILNRGEETSDWDDD